MCNKQHTSGDMKPADVSPAKEVGCVGSTPVKLAKVDCATVKVVGSAPVRGVGCEGKAEVRGELEMGGCEGKAAD